MRGSFGLPPWAYRSAELTDLECEALLRPSWQFVCHANQIKEVGAFVTLELNKDSVVVLRDQSQKVRAYHNICRHRGTKLLKGAGVCGEHIKCPYHGWSYGL